MSRVPDLFAAPETPCVEIAAPLGGIRLAGRGRMAAALWDDRRGVSAVVLALSLSALLGLAGLAVDAGLWYNDKRTEQGVADLAAWTAMYTYYDENESASAISDAKNAAQAVAAANGYKNGSGGVTVTANNPPGSGPNKSVPGAFEVIINKPENLFFSSSYLNSVTVQGRAVAAVTTSTSGSGAPGCILSKTTISLTGNADVGASTCSVYANGAGTGAISLVGNAVLTASDIYVVGGITTAGNSTTGSSPKVTGASPVSDPYASDTIAAAEGSNNMTCPNSNATTYARNGKAPPLTPGVYCGLTVNSNAVVTFQPGIYIIEGNLSFAGNAVVTGAGVTFVLTGSESADTIISGNANVTLSAPSSGPTAGLVFFGDPNNTGSVGIAGNGVVAVNGAIYFPNQSVSFQGNASNASGCTQLDAYAITFTGNADFGQNCGTSGTKQIGGARSTVTMSMLE
jgi:Flp pilus assembly protein TadG